MVILAEGEGLKRGLGVLEEWRSEWAIKMNSDKCDAMHRRRNGVKRTTTIFSLFPSLHQRLVEKGVRW